MAASEGQITRFLFAALNGNLSLLKRLAAELDNGEGLANTFTRVKGEEGRTALHFAAAGGHSRICDYLINRVKLDVNLKDVNEIKRNKALQLSKSKGEEAFKKKEYYKAMFWYTQAKRVNPNDATLYSNISLCWAILNEGDLALSEALDCVRLRPDWSKAHYRIGEAYKILKNYFKAAEAYSEALKLDPKNKDIECAFQEAVKLCSAGD